MSPPGVGKIRQAFRLKAHEALIHGNKGRKTAHALPESLKDLIAQKAEGDYKGTSCQHMAELLARRVFPRIEDYFGKLRNTSCDLLRHSHDLFLSTGDKDLA